MIFVKIISAVLLVSLLVFFNVKSIISLVHTIKDIKSKKEDSSE